MQHHHHHGHPQIQPQHALKRRPSEEMGGGPGSKKFILVGPWDLEIPTNIILFEKQPSLLPHPHPEVEVLFLLTARRARKFKKVQAKKIVKLHFWQF